MTKELRVDPLSGRPVLIAPARARRPGATFGTIEPETQEELDSCPFCAGREDRTPPETLALGRPEGAAPDTAGWHVRVVPNLYPAFEHQEVVVHGPEHVRSFGELSPELVTDIAEAWRLRIDAAREAGFGYVHALVNEGRAAGASLPHSHSQLVWMREEPPVVTAERVEALDGILGRTDLAVAEQGGVTLVVHPAGGLPYEMLVAGPGALADGLALLQEGVRRVRALEGPVPWNAWLHPGQRWHIHLVPRLSVLAGVELGAGFSINGMPPEDAVVELRRAANYA